MALPLCIVLLSALAAPLDWGSGDWGSGGILETGWGSGEFGSGVVEGDSPPSPPFSPPSPPLAVAEYRWFCKEDSGKSSHYPTCDSVCAGGEAICCSYPARSSSHPSGMRCLASTTGSNVNPVTQLPYWVDDALCGARPSLCDSHVVGPTRGLSQLSYYYQLPAKPVLEIDVGIPSDEALSYMVRQISDGDCYMITDRLASRWPGFGLGGVDCFTMITSIQGDGHCDRILNTAFYRFDGGDCDADALPWITDPEDFVGDDIGLIPSVSPVDRDRVASQVAAGVLPCDARLTGYSCEQSLANVTVETSVQFMSSGWRYFESMLRYEKDNELGAIRHGGGLLFIGGGSCRYATGPAGSGVTFEEAFNYTTLGVPTARRCYGGASLSDLYFNREVLLGPSLPRYLLIAAYSDVGRRSDEQGTNAESFKRVLEDWVVACRAANITLFLGGFKPYLDGNHARDVLDVVNGTRGRLNAYMRSHPGLTLIDWAPALQGVDGEVNAEYFVADGQHHSASGYLRLWSIAEPIIGGKIRADTPPSPPPPSPPSPLPPPPSLPPPPAPPSPSPPSAPPSAPPAAPPAAPPSAPPAAPPAMPPPQFVECGRVGACSEPSGWKAASEMYAVRCCSETKLGDSWKRRKGCDVFAESNGPEMEDAEGVQCEPALTYAEAVADCASAGARLCTGAELRADCAKGTGCGFDKRLAWAGEQ